MNLRVAAVICVDARRVDGRSSWRNGRGAAAHLGHDKGFSSCSACSEPGAVAGAGFRPRTDVNDVHDHNGMHQNSSPCTHAKAAPDELLAVVKWPGVAHAEEVGYWACAI
eukprot:354633-Chlamydomonas_euryale.AAC.8